MEAKINEIDAVISKIRSMCNRTVDNGCTEQEAMNSASKVGELLKVYNLSLDKVFLDEHQCIDLVVTTKQHNRGPVDKCVTAIASFCDCRVWFSKYHKSYDRMSDYHFFGLPTDTEMAKYLYDMIFSALENESKLFKQTDIYRKKKKTEEERTLLMIWKLEPHSSRKTTLVSFQKGMSNRISARLNEMRDKRHDEESEINVGATTTDIVLLKKDKVKEDFEKLGMRLTKSYNSERKYNYEAFSHGKMVGDRVNLNRPVDSRQQRLLT